MPSDQITTTETPARPVVRLIEALRSPLPEGFEWDFRTYAGCALRVAEKIGVINTIRHFRRVLPQDPFDAWEDGGVVPLYRVPARNVTPQMVADALERLARGKAEG